MILARVWLKEVEMKRKFSLPVMLVGVLVLGTAAALVVDWISDRNQAQVLTIATASRDGEYDRFAQALAKVVALHQPRLRLQVRQTSGSRENMTLLESRQVELAIAQSDTPALPSVQAVAALFPEAFHLIVQPNSGIQTVPDLKGKRVALMPKDSGSYIFFWKLLKHYGLTQKEVQGIPLDPAAAQAQFQQERVDALFRSIAPGNQGMQALIQTSQARLIALDQVAALQLTYPYLQRLQIPKGLYSGNPAIPPQDLTAASVRALLLTHQEVDPELIYLLTRTLYEYRNELSNLNPRAATISPTTSANSLGLPLNPGAEAFYTKNEPSFLERYAESIALLITVAGITVSCLWQLRMHLARKQKNRADAYNIKVLDLVDQISSCTSLADLAAFRRQLFEIFKRVVQDLDQDKLSPESFQAFAVSWQVTMTTIRDREALLLQQQSDRPAKQLGNSEG
jgi:uncharacterized protein